ncbi:MAG: SDR family oxidoreductase [Candidatus Bathyarchaeia archaeon]
MVVKMGENLITGIKGSIAVVSGGYQGIGKAVVDKLSSSGCKVYTIDPKFPSETRNWSSSDSVIFYSGYTNHEEDVKEFYQYIASREDKIDFLVNNAGIYLYKSIEESSISEFNRLVETNLLGTFILTKYFLPLLKKSSHASIVNVASVSGQRTEEGHPIYSLTKGGILAFTKATAADFGKYKIRVNSVSPGNIITPMNDLDIEVQAKSKGKSFDEVEKEYSSESILKRRGTADEVASVILFLLSSASSYVNGEDIIVDGGLYLV